MHGAERLRALLVALIVISTAAFVVGTTIERNSKHNESLATLKAEGNDAHAGDGAAHRKAEGLPPETSTNKSKSKEPSAEKSSGHQKTEGTPTESHAELKPLGIDIEAAPFVALAAAASLLLALAAWLRPRWLPLLVGIVAAMLVFAALDVREIFHQSDESRTGLTILAACVALLHVGAAAVAGIMSRRASLD
jgi:Flp pilus assembly protein TadB